MLAVSIVGILASLAIPNYIDFLEKARVARAISELHALAKEIKGFAIGGGGYPDTLAQIGHSTMLDPWGTPYQYYRINCTTDVEITNLARLKLRKKRPPRVLLADHPLRTSDGWHVSFAVDHGEHQDLLHLVAGGGGGAGGAQEGEVVQEEAEVPEEAEQEAAVARPVVELGEREKTGFSSRSTRTSMCTVWARIGIQKILSLHLRATMMSFARVTAGFTVWPRTSSLV